jgi:signal transduction histidine kinase
MASEITQENLKALQASLYKLRSFSLPPDADAIVNEAIQHAEQLCAPPAPDDKGETALQSQPLQEKARFVSVITHELRIPMTSIKGYADLLRQGVAGPLNEQQNEFIDVIRNNIERMSALVSNLSDISRLETGRLRLEPALIPLRLVVDKALSDLRPKISDKNQALEINVPESLPPAFADQNRVIQVLTNLIGNAWKYTPRGGKIRIHAREHDRKLFVEVNDTGIGISQQDQTHLFDQFFRSEDPAVRDQQGWGLGLNVTKQLVELMGGEIGCQSSLESGSSFWFTLPMGEI